MRITSRTIVLIALIFAGAFPWGSPAHAAPLYEVVRQGKVRVTATPRHSYRVQEISIRNLTSKALDVDLTGSSLEPPAGAREQRVGLSFITKTDGSHTVRIKRGAVWKGTVNSVCRDSGRACPTPGRPFRVSRSPVSKAEAKVLAYWAAHPMVSQGAINSRVWDLNNNRFVGDPVSGLPTSGSEITASPGYARPSANPAIKSLAVFGGQVFVEDTHARLMMYSVAGNWHVYGDGNGALARSSGALYGRLPGNKLGLFVESNLSWMPIGSRANIKDMASTPKGNLIVLRENGALEEYDRYGQQWKFLGSEVGAFSVNPTPGSDDLYALRRPERGFYELWRLKTDRGVYTATKDRRTGAMIKTWRARGWRRLAPRARYSRIAAAAGGVYVLDRNGALMFRPGPGAGKNRARRRIHHVTNVRAARDGAYVFLTDPAGTRCVAYLDRNGVEVQRTSRNLNKFQNGVVDPVTARIYYRADRRIIEVYSLETRVWAAIEKLPE